MKTNFSFSNTGKSHKVKACPVSYDQVDKHLIKAYSSIILIILGYTFFTGNHWAMYLVTLDFLIRVFIGIKYSPLCNFLTAFMNITPLKPILVNAGTKKIAAQVGLIFALSICIFSFLGWQTASNVFIIMFALAISLDLFFDYCLACKMQSLYLTYFKK